MTTADIGAARVHLIVDADGVDRGIAQAKNSMQGFGAAAERAFERSSDGVRKATNRIADYVAGLKSVDGQMERQLRQLARLGADDAIIKSLAQSWREVHGEVRESAAAIAEAQRINAAFDAQRAAAAQRNINDSVAPGLGRDAADTARRRADAEAALLPVLEQQEASLRQQQQLTDAINIARRESVAQDAQRQWGSDWVDDYQKSAQYMEEQARVVRALVQQDQLRESAAARITAELNEQHQAALRINQAFDQNRAEMAQQSYNTLLGVGDTRTASDLAQQRQAVAALTQQFQQLDNEIDQAFAQNANADRFIQQLRNMEQAAGRTHYEMLELKAAQLGISQQAAPLINAYRQQNEQMGRGTLTAKQYQQAMRGLPAQITDITVSLASGMPVYMVALQQGGQLKDMFGGIGPAAKALGSAALGMLNPLTLVGAALGAVAIGAFSAEGRLSDFAQSSIVSGGFAGTARELEEIADRLNDIENISRGNADKAAQTAARSGRLTGENYRMQVEAAAAWATATGAAVEEVTRKFDALSKDPLDALLKLNEAERFLTEAQYDRVKALVAEGDQQAAVSEAVRIYFETVTGRSQEVVENLGATRRAWLDIKDAVGEAWGAFGEFSDGAIEGLRAIGEAQNIVRAGFIDILTQSSRSGSVMDRVRGIGRGVYQQFYPETDVAGMVQKGVAAGVGFSDTPYDPDEAKRIRERDAATKAWLATADKEAGRRIALNKIEEEGIKLGQSKAQIEAVQQRQRAEWARADQKQGGRAPSGRDATQMIRDQLAAELASMQTQQKAVEISYQQRTITVEAYYDSLLGFAQRERDLTVQSNEAQIAALAGKRDAERQISTLRANSARAEESFAQRKMELDAGELQSIRQREAAYRDYVRSLGARTEGIERDMAAQVAAVTSGSRQVEIQQRINEIYREQAEALRALNDQVDDGAITAQDAERRRQAVLAETVRSIDAVREGYVRIDEAQGVAVNGFARAYQDFAQQTKDVAGTVYDMTTTVFGGIGDAAADMATKGKASFSDLADSILADVMRLGTNKMLMALIGGVSGGGGYTGTLGDLFGGSWGFAKGGVPGGEALGAYRNQIVSKPTFFPFAKGGVPNMGLMGEAGAEAIMPLKRDSNGRLGVSGGGGGIPNIVVNAHGVDSQPEVSASMGSDGTVTIDMLFGQFEGRMAERYGAGVGPMAAVQKNIYGGSRR